MNVAIKSGLLMRVLTVTQVLQLDELAVGLGREQLARRRAVTGFEVDRREIVTDGAVILADAVKGGHRQSELGLLGELAVGLEFGQHLRILRSIGQHADVLPVFGRASDHRRAADVDVLNRVFQRAAGLGHRGLERVEVDHQQINGVNAVRL